MGERTQRSRALVAAWAVAAAWIGGCGRDNPTQPTPTPTYTLTGALSDAVVGHALQGVSVTVSSGPSPGSTSSDSGGTYSITGLQSGAYTLSFAQPGYLTASAAVNVPAAETLHTMMVYDVPAVPSTASLTGYWTGTGTYPNNPFKLLLIHGTAFGGRYRDQHDEGYPGGTHATGAFDIVIDFGDAKLHLECLPVEHPREIHGVQRTSALGNRPYPFTMTR